MRKTYQTPQGGPTEIAAEMPDCAGRNGGPDHGRPTPGRWVAIDKMNPATWERTGETMPDGAPVLLNPGSGLPCVMPRPSWPNPHIPRSVQVYRSEARDQLDKAAPDMLEALKQAEQQIDYGQIDAAHRIIIAAIARATGVAS